ncbi:MAG: group 1 truncated hemoglobin [Planctomycetota bacterium]
MTKTDTLFDKIGGKAALRTVVDEFYRRILADHGLAPMFANTDMNKQRGHQAAFLAAALGGPDEYRGKDMRAAHEHLHITQEQFGLVAMHLQSTLEWARVPAAELGQIMGAAASLAPQVVSA